MELKVGAPVLAEDGRVGTLDRLVFDPARGEVTGLVVVAQSGLLPHDVIVPIAEVVSAGDDGVRVRGAAGEIAEYPGFSHTQFAAPPEEWLPPPGSPPGAYLFPQSPFAIEAFTPPSPVAPPPEDPVEELSPGDVDLGANTEVVCTDGPAGVVSRVVTEGASDIVTHLIVRGEGLRVREHEVPVSLVDRVTDAGIFLTISRKELDELPEFKD